MVFPTANKNKTKQKQAWNEQIFSTSEILDFNVPSAVRDQLRMKTKKDITNNNWKPKQTKSKNIQTEGESIIGFQHPINHTESPGDEQ